jgi:ABC-2 type transport system permease protein
MADQAASRVLLHPIHRSLEASMSSVSNLSIIGRESLAEILKAARLPVFALPTVLTPAVFYGLFTLGIGSPSPEAATWSLATFGVFSALGPALFGFGAGVAQERETGQLALKRLSPMPAGAHLIGKLAATFVFIALAMVLITTLALVAGVNLTLSQWAAMLTVHLLSAIPFAFIGLGLGYRLGSKGAVAAANALFLALAVLGGLWFPVSIMPHWLQSLAWGLPSWHLSELALIAAGFDRPTDALMHAVVVAVMTLAAGLFALSGLRRSEA